VLVAVVALSVGQTLQSRQIPARPAQDRPQSDAPPATGLIVGQVVDAATGKPVPGAVVSLTQSPLALAAAAPITPEIIEMPQTGPAVPTRVIANAEGRFVYRNLPKGRYGFSAAAIGYLAGSYGQRRAGGPGVTLELEEGEKLLDAVFRLWKAATITGTVLDEAGEPVVGVTVRTLRRGIGPVMSVGRARWTLGLTATTDDRGMYRIASLAPAEYTVAVMSSTATMPMATVEAYRDMVMSGPGATTNLTRDLSSSGAPFPSASGMRVGDQMIQTSTFGRGASAPAPAETGKMLAYPTTYYPSATSPAQLTVITLGSGEERTGVDIHLRLVSTVKVTGAVSGPEGPAPNMGVRLVPANIDAFTSDSGLETAITATDAAGAFTLLGVPPGAYTVKVLKTPRPAPPSAPSEGMVMVSTGTGTAFGTSLGPTTTTPPPLPTEPTLWASVPLTVAEADVAGVSLVLRHGARVTGRVEFEGTRTPPTPDQLQRMSVTLQPLDARTIGGVTIGRVTADQQFRTLGYTPGRYLVTAGGAGTDWTLKSAMFGGRDVSDEPLDIGSEDISGIVLVFTDRSTQLTGTVRNAQNQADPDADVVVFPANHQLWKDVVNPRRARSVRTTKTGAYTLQGLPPGEYYVVAFSSASTREWQDPRFLEAAAPLATRVTILDGDKKSLDLRTTRLR
jgi:protocatechuate 3,4-dioxygenase beta subunit